MESFLKDFSRSLRAGLASVFAGAGMSRESGLPTWDELLAPLRRAADVPTEVKDPTVAAEYISTELGADVLADHVLRATYSDAAPSPSQRILTELSLRRVWTTNYDQLLERAFGKRGFAIVNDSDFGKLQHAGGQTVIVKLHGSVGQDHNGLPAWTRTPIITRSHFEGFATDRPLLWHDVSANFLTTSFLFLGFSFDDPNVEVLLRLSRSLPADIRRLPHYAIMRRPADPKEQRFADLRWRDLSRAGIEVVVIDDYGEVFEILQELKRRLQPAGLFIAGSNLSPAARSLLEATGNSLAKTTPAWHLNSLSGEAAVAFGSGMSAGLKEQRKYDPERLRFHFRGSESPRTITDRMGTIIFHEETDKNVVRRRVLEDSRLVLAAGGESGTAEELSLAREAGLPILALPTGGASEAYSEFLGAGLSDDNALLNIVHRAELDPESAGRELAAIVRRLLAL